MDKVGGLSEKFSRLKKALPAIAFGAGFLWDVITLGIKIKPTDLFIILIYYLGAGLCLYIIGRGLTFKYSKYIPLGLQFFLGGIFSALVVFYFKSSSHLWGYGLVGLLIGLLVLNEFLADHYQKTTVSWMMFTLCGAMFLNFGLPHLVGSVHGIWFYISTALALGATWGLKKFTGRPFSEIAPSVAVLVALVFLSLMNWIPPVPLVQKNLIVLHKIEKEKGAYLGHIEQTPWWKKVFQTKMIIHKPPGHPVTCFTSIFAPSGISTTIYHHWEYFNTTSDKWESRDRIGFSIKSGRESGYRGYTFKSNVPNGLWKVSVVLKNGRSLGSKKFRVQTPEEGSFPELKIVRLN